MTAQSNHAFGEWLLSVGNGSGQTDFTEDIDIPFGQMYRHSDKQIVAERAIITAYVDMHAALNSPDSRILDEYFGGRLILAPLNSDVNPITLPWRRVRFSLGKSNEERRRRSG
jgi:hypothetical protein